MANILSLALKVNADASGVVKNLTPAERALEKLATEADKVTKVFDQFAAGSASAAAAQRQAATDFAFLNSAMKTGQLTAQQYAEEYAKLEASSRATAASFARGLEVTSKYATEEQRRADIVAELDRLLQIGAISEGTYSRAVFDGSESQKNALEAERNRLELLKQGQKITEQFATVEERRAKQLDEVARLLQEGAISEETAARARAEFSGANEEAQRVQLQNAAALTETINKEAAAFKRAADITKANISPQEKYADAVDELDDQLKAGRISQETYNRAMEKAKTDLDRAADSTKKADKETEKLAKNVSLIAKVEIGRLLLDGLRTIGSVFRDIGSQVTSFATTVNASLNTLDDFAQRTGVEVEALQGYSLAAKLAGVDTEQFLGAVQKLAVNIGKATPGDALDKSLKGINLSVTELRALSPEDQFSAIADAISQLPTAADRAAAAVEIFGKQGAALAPLFKEGAASIEELQARAERLGIIVSETQVNNVTQMNDAFDLVLATVNGIIGQVMGNLAPAVTEVTNQFLKFVEEWSGTTGEGGTGIANAITDVLLEGATYFAGIFDEFMSSFSGISETLSGVSAGFDMASGVFKALVGTFSAIVTTFNIIGNAVAVALGKVLENIGSYLSSDLEQFGRDLAVNATDRMNENIARLEEAGREITEGASQAVFGSPEEQQAAGGGAAGLFIEGMRARIERERSPQFQIETNIEETRERFDGFFDGIVDQESAVTAGMRDFEQAVRDVADPMNMTAEEIARIEEASGRVNQLIDQERQKRTEAADAARAQAESDAKRLDQLLETNDQAAKIESDLLVVQREQARVSEQLAAARAAGSQADADAAVARMAELDQLEARLEEDQQALSQGFDQGFQAAFDQVDQSISGLIDKSQQFGQAGFDAALKLQEGIKAAQDQASAGILNEEAFNREVERQKQLYDDELKRLDDVAKAKQKAEEDAVAAAQKQQEDVQRAQEEYQKQQADAVQKYQEQQQKQYEEYAKAIQAAAEKEAARQEERIKKLNTLGEQKISVSDVRTAEGAALVLGLIASGQDPALIQARMQTKYLQQIAQSTLETSNRFAGPPVAIAGATFFG